ncbi:MAG: c-type cytochrome [Thermoanaerobaculia bacterium]
MGRTKLAGIVALTLTLGAAAARGQDWHWPEQAKNLKVLPKDTPADKLRGSMLGFVRGLGVRCAYCHVGEEGRPLSSYDFTSDENPNKDKARAMMKMLAGVQEQLAKIEPSGPERVAMTCSTCHAGRPRPASLEEELLEAFQAGGQGAALERYAELRGKFYGRGGYDFGERALSSVGERLLGKGETEGALAMLRLNSEQFPASTDVWADLAAAYAKTGNAEIAAIYFRKALELDPGNEDALDGLHHLPPPSAPAPAANPTP